MLFKKNLDKSNQKPNKIYRDKRSEFYNRSMKLWLQDKPYSTHKEKNMLLLIDL